MIFFIVPRFTWLYTAAVLTTHERLVRQDPPSPHGRGQISGGGGGGWW